jgi:hypothetical protein
MHGATMKITDEDSLIYDDIIYLFAYFAKICSICYFT